MPTTPKQVKIQYWYIPMQAMPIKCKSRFKDQNIISFATGREMCGRQWKEIPVGWGRRQTMQVNFGLFQETLFTFYTYSENIYWLFIYWWTFPPPSVTFILSSISRMTFVDRQVKEAGRRQSWQLWGRQGETRWRIKDLWIKDNKSIIKGFRITDY